jgi:hypothetical protein
MLGSSKAVDTASALRDVKLSWMTPSSESCLKKSRFVLVSYEDHGRMARLRMESRRISGQKVREQYEMAEGPEFLAHWGCETGLQKTYKSAGRENRVVAEKAIQVVHLHSRADLQSVDATDTDMVCIGSSGRAVIGPSGWEGPHRTRSTLLRP